MWERANDTLILIETKLGHEADLVGHRMTWLMVSQSFLFGVWAAIPQSALLPPARMILFSVLCIVGFVTSYAAWLSTAAALDMIDELLDEQVSTEQITKVIASASAFVDRGGVRHTLRPPSVGVHRRLGLKWTLAAGHFPPKVLPLVFLGAWVAIIVSRLLSAVEGLTKSLEFVRWIALAIGLLFAVIVYVTKPALTRWIGTRYQRREENEKAALEAHISRKERTGSEWLEALRGLASGAAPVARGVATDFARLWRVLDDSRERLSTRAAAAVVLMASGHKEAAPKLRFVAEGVGDTPVRVALENIADEKAVAEALEVLDARDEERKRTM